MWISQYLLLDEGVVLHLSQMCKGGHWCDKKHFPTFAGSVPYPQLVLSWSSSGGGTPLSPILGASEVSTPHMEPLSFSPSIGDVTNLGLSNIVCLSQWPLTFLSITVCLQDLGAGRNLGGNWRWDVVCQQCFMCRWGFNGEESNTVA